MVALELTREPAHTERRRHWRAPFDCMPPLALETLNHMAAPDDGNEYTSGELYRAIAGLRDEMTRDLTGIKDSLGRVVYVDVFTATMATALERESAIRAHAVAESASIRALIHASDDRAASAHVLAMWALGMICSAVIGAVVVAIVAAARM